MPRRDQAGGRRAAEAMPAAWEAERIDAAPAGVGDTARNTHAHGSSRLRFADREASRYRGKVRRIAAAVPAI